MLNTHGGILNTDQKKKNLITKDQAGRIGDAEKRICEYLFVGMDNGICILQKG